MENPDQIAPDQARTLGLVHTILKDFLGTISATERDYFRIIPTFKVAKKPKKCLVWSIPYGPFLTQGYKTCDTQGEKETY